MTTTATAPKLVGPVKGGGFKGAVAFEWTKFWSVRATWWNLTVGLLLTVGFAAMVGASADASAKKGVDVTMPAPHHASQAFLISQLAIVVLATLALTSEYSSGSIRTTLQSVPKRGRMLRCKTLVIGAVVVAAGFVFSLLGTLVAAPLMGEHGDYTGGQLLGTALGAGVYLGLLAVMAIGLGTVLRSAAGTITTLIMVLLALPQLMASSAPSGWRPPPTTCQRRRHRPADPGQRPLRRRSRPAGPRAVGTGRLRRRLRGPAPPRRLGSPYSAPAEHEGPHSARRCAAPSPCPRERGRRAIAVR